MYTVLHTGILLSRTKAQERNLPYPLGLKTPPFAAGSMLCCGRSVEKAPQQLLTYS